VVDCRNCGCEELLEAIEEEPSREKQDGNPIQDFAVCASLLIRIEEATF
jgi:hypothetical protein